MAKTALIIDDSASMRLMVAHTLTSAGFTVLQASNGQEGLDKLSGQRVEVIITDLNMPAMDGLEFIRQLRTRPPYKFTPVLVLTTEASSAMVQAGKAAGATGWLVKPFNPEQVLKVLAKVLP
jgi:two-component system chemotaxis response regulator CheY